MNDTAFAQPRAAARPLTVVGARALLGDRFEDAVVRIGAGHIAEIAGSEGTPSGDRFDARGRLLLPGIVDLHGDAFERSLLPRPGVSIPPAIGFDEADRVMAAFGITTAFHGVTLSWEPGLRGRDTALALLHALAARKSRLRCDTRVHLRVEVQNHAAVPDIVPLLQSGAVGVLAFNDHWADTLRDLATPEKAARYPGRTGVSVDALHTLMAQIDTTPAAVERTVATLAEAARAAGVPTMSHDDPDLSTRARYRALGARIAEFPLSEEVAADARSHGEPVVMGSPNVLRGGSHKPGNPSAATLVADGLCTVLTSDYYYPAPLHAAFRLAADGTLPLERAWPLVSENPAAAARLTDRGRIAPGQRADLLLVDPGPASAPHPDVIATFVEGRTAFSADRA